MNRVIVVVGARTPGEGHAIERAAGWILADLWGGPPPAIIVGIYLTHAAGSTVTIDDVIVTQSANYGIYVSGDTTLSALTVLGTGANAVRVVSGSMSLSTCDLDSGSDHDLYFANSASIVGSMIASAAVSLSATVAKVLSA